MVTKTKVVLFLLLGSLISCENENSEINSQETKQNACDLIDFESWKNNVDQRTNTAKAPTITEFIGNLDSDNDGVGDYAEDHIVGLDKNNPNDAINFDVNKEVQVIRDNGTQYSLEWYRTSFFQNTFLNPGTPTYNDSELTQEEITILKPLYYQALKVMRTPEFQNYIKNKPTGGDYNLFYTRCKDFVRTINFRSRPDTVYPTLASAGYTELSYAHWTFMDKSARYWIEAMPHELIHLLRYDHSFDYAYGGGAFAGNMIKDGKDQYEVIDLEKMRTYSTPQLSKFAMSLGYGALNYCYFDNPSVRITYGYYSDSEDPITINETIKLQRGKTYKLIAAASNTQSFGMWIDFDDNAFYNNDPSEKVSDLQFMHGGLVEKQITFTIPANAKLGKHYTRLNTEYSNLNYTSVHPYNERYYGSSVDFTNVVITD